MPLSRVAEVAIEVPAQSGARTRVGAGSGGKARPNSKGNRQARRFSPYKSTAAEAAVPPGPASLLASEVDALGLGDGPISTRTRARRLGGFKAHVPPPTASPGKAVSAPATVGESSAAAHRDAAAAGPSSDAADGNMCRQAGDPVERQRIKEERWKERLRGRSQTSWWDSAQIAVSELALKADTGLAGVSKAACQANGSLRTLARGRNHAKAEMERVDGWRNEAVDTFVRGPAPPPAPEPYVELPPAEANYSPGHFDRRYGRKARPLPPLNAKMATRKAAASALQREAANLAARSRVFAVAT